MWFVLFSVLNLFTIEKPKIALPTHIVFAGDIMLSRKVGAFLKQNKNWVFKSYNPFEEIVKKYSYVNIFVANLESPLVYKNDNDYATKTMMFRSNASNVSVLNTIKNLSINKILVVNLANNHIRNGQRQGLLDTMDILNKNNIFFVGAGINPVQSHKILALFVNNEKICFQGYSYDGSYKYGYAVNSLNKKYIKKDLETMKKKGCNKKVLLVHWGIEYLFYPTKFQKKLAHFMVDNGADIVVGGHSHTLQYQEKYKGKIIVYSLGNMIFDQNWGEQYRGKNMNCIFNNKKKCVVPTYISTLLYLNLSNPSTKLLFSRINFGQLLPLYDNILKENMMKIYKNTIFKKD